MSFLIAVGRLWRSDGQEEEKAIADRGSKTEPRKVSVEKLDDRHG
jgi:hypothetical protein